MMKHNSFHKLADFLRSYGEYRVVIKIHIMNVEHYFIIHFVILKTYFTEGLVIIVFEALDGLKKKENYCQLFISTKNM